jgi:hypothetical protein
MNARELRIGCYVNLFGEKDGKRAYYPAKTTSIHSEGVGVEIICKNMRNTDNGRVYDIKLSAAPSLDKIEPIPLTEELLLKCGFEKRVWGNVTYYNPNLDLDRDFRVRGIDWNVQIKYLHQLQNLFFALTGEELEVKL